jgi:hypothetical protein
MLSYQWSKGGTPISGATAASYTISSVQTTDAGGYRVEVSNSVGSVVSDAATLTIASSLRAGDDFLGAVENRSVTVAAAKLLSNDSGAPGNALSISAVSAMSTNGGAVMLSSGNVTYTPVPTYTGADLFTYTLSDGAGGTATGTVFVGVTSANAPSKNQIGNPVPTENGVLVRFAGIVGRTYGIERSVDSVTWVALGNAIAQSNGVIEFEDTAPAAGAAYRTVVP